jgi:hypothetical protein
MKRQPNKRELRNIGGELLAEGVALRITATGYSMFPAVRPGDQLEIAPLMGDAESLQSGDIVAVKRDDDFVVHRFMAAVGEDSDGGRLLLTRGDATPAYDKPVRAGEIAGVVTGIIRGERRLASPLRQTTIRYRFNRLLARACMIAARVRGLAGARRHRA